MKINNIGYHFQHGRELHIHRPNGSGDYMMLFLKTGATFTLNGFELLVPPNHFIFYNRGTPQDYRASEDVFINDWLHFDLDESELNELCGLQIPFDTPLPCGDTTYFSQIIQNMYQEKYSANLYKEATLELYFKLLLVKLSERLESSSPAHSYPYYEKMSLLRMKIYRNPTKNWSIEELAKETMLSESYFQHLYKQIFGISPMLDVIHSRMEHGKYLLSSTDDSVREIAIACGYKNDVHFMRQFRRITGVTPSQYRKQFRVSAEELRHMEQNQPFNLKKKKKEG